MRTLIAVWLARWEAGVFLRLIAVADWLLKPVAVAGRAATVHPPTNRPGHHHTAEEHAVPGMWLLAPRAAIGLWLAGAVVAFAHDIHLLGRPAVEIHQLGPVGGH
jgi:hypothetical protein